MCLRRSFHRARQSFFNIMVLAMHCTSNLFPCQCVFRVNVCCKRISNGFTMCANATCVHSNIPLKPPNAAARRLAYERALKHLNEVVPVPQPRQLNGDFNGQEELALAPATRNPAQEAAKAAREAMAGGNYVRAVGCLRRAMSLNHKDRALKDMLKTAEAQVQHRECYWSRVTRPNQSLFNLIS